MNFKFTKTVTQEVPFDFKNATQKDMDNVVDELTQYVHDRCESEKYRYFLKSLIKFVEDARKGYDID